MLASLLPNVLNLLGGAALGALGWAYILHGRVSKIEGRYEAILDLLQTRFDAADQRLDRIERSLNGALLKH